MLLKSFRKEIVAVTSVLIILIVLSIVSLFLGRSFVWQNISPISTPDFWNRIFWSALTFITLGYGLCKTYFYRALSRLFGGNRAGYRDAKKIIWLGLMYINYHIFTAVIDILNQVISIIFNLTMMAVYYAPILLVGLILGLILGVFVEYKTIVKLIRA